MSILTKPSILKGVPAQLSLNKAELLNHPLVEADSYFSNGLNWNRVNVIFKSSEGSQYEIVEFDASQSTPTGTFLVSERARDQFQVIKIKILDFDGGFFEIPRSSLTVSEFDISLSSSYVRDFSNPNTKQTYESFSGPAFPTIENNALSWTPGNLGSGGYTSTATELENFMLGQSCKIRIHISDMVYNPYFMYENPKIINELVFKGESVNNADLPSNSVLTSSIGSYVEITATAGSENSFYLKLSGTVISIKISKIEIIPV